MALKPSPPLPHACCLRWPTLRFAAAGADGNGVATAATAAAADAAPALHAVPTLGRQQGGAAAAAAAQHAEKLPVNFDVFSNKAGASWAC